MLRGGSGGGIIRCALCAVAALLSQPAIAEAVVVKCTITSGNPGWVMNGNSGRTGRPITYKIGDGKWLVWGESGPKWGRNYCTDIGLLHVVEGANVSCNLDTTLFDVTMVSPDGDIVYEVKIDRQTGAITTSESVSPDSYNPSGIDRRSAGTCEKTEEPKPPLPPPTKF